MHTCIHGQLKPRSVNRPAEPCPSPRECPSPWEGHFFCSFKSVKKSTDSSVCLEKWREMQLII